MTDGDEKILTEDDMELKIKMQSEITQKLQMIDQDLTKLLVYLMNLRKNDKLIQVTLGLNDQLVLQELVWPEDLKSSKKIEKAGVEIADWLDRFSLQWTNIMTDEQKAEFKRISAKLLKELFGFVKEAKGANDV